MSNLQIALKAHSQTSQETELISKNFKLELTQPSHIERFLKKKEAIEFILNELIYSFHQHSFISAKKLGLQIDRLQIHLVGQINPEILLYENRFSKSQGDLNIEIKIAGNYSAKQIKIWLQDLIMEIDHLLIVKKLSPIRLKVKLTELKKEPIPIDEVIYKS